MTNSKKGIKGRIDQFDNTLKSKAVSLNHGGADRVRYKHKNYDELVRHLYVSICTVHYDVTSNKPKDLIKKGEVAQLEYLCWAEYVKKHDILPEFNDSTRSPKKYSKACL